MNYTDRKERLIASYCRLVKSGKITINDVPEKFREEVAIRIESKRFTYE